MTSPRVAIIGAGFSGLTLALELVRLGLQVEVFEAQAEAGGLIRSRKNQVLVETAAHALLASRDVEDLFQDLALIPVIGGYRSKAKWIFRQKARKWPFSLKETAHSFWALARAKFAGELLPMPNESLFNWADRNRLSKFREQMLAPALQGIYGSQPEKLAASLVLGALFTPELRLKKGKVRGSLAPKQGMQELIDKMVETLRARKALVHFQTVASLESLQNSFDAVIVAASARGAAEILKDSAPQLASGLKALPAVSLLTVTLGYSEESSRIKGFGCLFPKAE
ncbi:MAG: protoporphyrinogen/coproporphyrinogen oxidase, partial [Pseudobdellovibrionaceae bacterium]